MYSGPGRSGLHVDFSIGGGKKVFIDQDRRGSGSAMGGSHPADEELIERYYRCDAGALGTLYERWGPRLERFLCRHGFPQADAEDLSTETFVRVMETKDRRTARYDLQKSRFGTWLWRIAWNLWKDAWKRRGRRFPTFPRRPTPSADPDLEIPDDGPSSEDLAEAARLREVIHECLKRLPERERFVVSLWMAMDGARLKDLAEALGTSVPTAYRVFQQAIRRIGGCLKRKGYGEKATPSGRKKKGEG